LQLCLGQTLIECKIPANLQESADSGVVLTDAEVIGNQEVDVELWKSLQLDVYKGKC